MREHATNSILIHVEERTKVKKNHRKPQPISPLDPASKSPDDSDTLRCQNRRFSARIAFGKSPKERISLGHF
jgi:hypothetical protein